MGLYLSDITFTPAKPANAAITSVAQSDTSVVLLAANVDRQHVTIYNDSNRDLFVAFAATASTTSYTIKIPKNGYFEAQSDGYTGVISGIWDSAGAGAAKITEVS